MDDLSSEVLKWGTGYVDESKLQKFLEVAKSYYEDELSSTQLDDSDLIYFSWARQPLHIYLIRTSGNLDFNQIFVMASQEKGLLKNEITYIDKLEETSNAFFKHSNEQGQLKYIFKETNISENINPESVIQNSIYSISISSSIRLWINVWFGKEINHAKQPFDLAPIELKFNDLGLHSQEYKLKEIVVTVDDLQFTRELEECMTAFEHEYYYPAAAGLGGIMESLLHKTLENYQRANHKIIGSDPTLSIYLSALKNFDLIDRRQSNRIRAAFVIRNSISHYNSGFTAVSDIQNMLHGIENIYSTLYLPSLEWKEAHPNQQLPEPTHRHQ